MQNNRRSTQINLALIVSIIAIIVGVTNPKIRQFFGIEKKPDSYAQNTYTPIEIKSEVGAEAQLIELEKLLKQGDFKAADQKTSEIMLYVTNRAKEGYKDGDKAKVSCTDLRTIDQLWVNNSNGRFGFSVQKRIFEENGKNRDKFWDAIGWTSGAKQKSYDDMTFAQNAEKGHFPAVGPGTVKQWWWGGGEAYGMLRKFRLGYYLSLVDACKM